MSQDLLYELDETLTVSLNAPINATVAGDQATGTIYDDDVPPQIGFSSASYAVFETEGSTTVTVTLSGATQLTATVEYAAGDGTATDGEDYTAIAGTLTFTPGVMTHTLPILIHDDELDEIDETVLLTLTQPTSASLGTGSAVLLIVDNEGEPTVSIADASAGESEGTIVFDVRLSFASDQEVSVDYATSDEPPGPGSATAGADYTPTSDRLTIAAGALEGQIAVTVLPDDVYEGDETFAVELSNPDNASLTDGLGRGTLVDDDSPPVIAFQSADYAASEGVAGGSTAITVTLSGATALTATVDYEAGDGSAGPDDYTALSGTLTFTPGVTSRAFQVSITDDALDEPDETVLLALANAGSAGLGLHEATLTIQDDDAPPAISIGDGALEEADMSILLPVTLTAPSSFDINVRVVTSDGTGPAAAQAGADYVAASGILTLPAGTQSAWASVTLLDDALYEPDETFLVTLSDPVQAALGDAAATATIRNDDGAPQLSFETDLYTVDEEAGAVTLTVTLSGPTAITATVDYATADGPAPAGAQAGEDYVHISDTLTFPPGEAQQPLTISIVDDTLPEVSETFVVALQDATHGTVGANNPATVRIYDGDGQAIRVYLPLTLRQAEVTAQTGSRPTGHPAYR